MGMIVSALMLPGAVAAAPLVGPWPVDDPSEVLVLGTPHLSGIETLKPEWLDPLLDRLEAWKPQLITIEGLSGPECYLLRRYDKSWPDTASDYCSRTESLAALAGKTTGLDMPAAEAAAELALAKMGPDAIPAAHRHLAALFSAAGNVGSAAVQWLRLPPAERRAGDGVDEALAKTLDELIVRRNENYLIAATLAARLGLERVYPTDDHLSDRVQAEAPPGQDRAMQAIWSGERPPLARQAQAMEKALADGASLLAYYRFMNRADVGEAFVRADMGKAFATPSPEHFGRRYVAWWETRNLHMVANVRAAMGHYPGQRALVIVGATHKPYLDAYLGMMHEIRLVPAAQVLGK
ncbi:hypothetical protein GON01_14365 [Sphingomonas sp. MAH-20]|uniref:TraB/GumN family protein n=1 Tax=Sphingomonas horti TaxID=2682842 RepID=A0A6I4J3U9_9SPHN|nr:hypothetical protein [Sphingomonas horti]